eukprot:125265-Prymnesium_polylepis.1
MVWAAAEMALVGPVKGRATERPEWAAAARVAGKVMVGTARVGSEGVLGTVADEVEGLRVAARVAQ